MKARGMGGLYRRGKVWWVRYWHRGKGYRESSGSTVRADAVRLLRKRQAEMGRGRFTGPEIERTTFEELAALLVHDYRVNGRRSLARAKQNIAHLRDFFGQSRALDISSDRVDAYIVARQEADAASATIRLELAALGRMFTLGVRAGKVAFQPKFPSLEVHNTRTGFFEEPELRAVIRHLPEHLRAVVEFAYLTGWRKGEAIGLQWRQVDFTAGTVRLEPGTTKNDEGRTFPFAALPELRGLLERQREATAALEGELECIIPWVFHRAGRSLRDFHTAWRTACRKAGAVRLFHDLRRTAVRNLERAGVPRSWAMKLTGHKTESVYRRYAIVSESDLFEGVQRLAAMRTGTKPAQFRALARADAPGEAAQVLATASAGSRIRTCTGLPPADFKSAASTIPPSRQQCTSSLGRYRNQLPPPSTRHKARAPSGPRAASSSCSRGRLVLRHLRVSQVIRDAHRGVAR